MHRNVSYNCRVVCLNRRVVGIRPKIYLANDGNYREMRWFTPWFIDPTTPGFGELQDFVLPPVIAELTKQSKVPIGVFAVATKDTAVSFETCEELFTPNSPHIGLSLDGIEIIANGSGSHHQLRKLQKRIELVSAVLCRDHPMDSLAGSAGAASPCSTGPHPPSPLCERSPCSTGAHPPCVVTPP